MVFFLTKTMGGVVRFAQEVLRELDKICKKNEFELIVPEHVQNIPEFKNINVIKYGRLNGILWEQINFPFYVIHHKRQALYLLNSWSILRPDYPAIHDCGYVTVKHFFKNTYGRFSAIYHGILYRVGARRGKKILTVSEYSKNDIVKCFHISPDKVIVLQNGWQHFKRVESDYSVFDRIGNIKQKEYYLSVSSLTPQKNFEWVLQVSKRNKDSQFLIVGESMGLTLIWKEDIPKNVRFLGKMSDEEIKALMSECKAFLHPSLHEGFAITPLEALSVGADIIISDKTCLPEIYGDSAHYIDPYNFDVDLEELLTAPVGAREVVLNKYSWENAAKLLYSQICF